MGFIQTPWVHIKYELYHTTVIIIQTIKILYFTYFCPGFLSTSLNLFASKIGEKINVSHWKKRYPQSEFLTEYQFRAGSMQIPLGGKLTHVVTLSIIRANICEWRHDDVGATRGAIANHNSPVEVLRGDNLSLDKTIILLYHFLIQYLKVSWNTLDTYLILHRDMRPKFAQFTIVLIYPRACYLHVGERDRGNFKHLCSSQTKQCTVVGAETKRTL